MKTTIVFCLIAATALLAEAYHPETPLRAGSRRKPKIVGGEEAKPNSIPYQVGLLLEGRFCGGSLITKRYVLTAAHCGVIVDDPVVVMGAHKINAEEPKQVSMKAKRVYVHEEYSRQNLQHDIALIELPEDAPLSDHIQTVKLTSPKARSFVGKTAQVSGWGRQYDFFPGISPVLRVVQSTIMAPEACQRKFGFNVLSTVICLDGSRGKSSCNGDSGGPLVVKNKNETIQIGVVSYGSSAGCEVGYPSAYTRLTSYIDWVKEHSDYED